MFQFLLALWLVGKNLVYLLSLHPMVHRITIQKIILAIPAPIRWYGIQVAQSLLCAPAIKTFIT